MYYAENITLQHSSDAFTRSCVWFGDEMSVTGCEVCIAIVVVGGYNETEHYYTTVLRILIKRHAFRPEGSASGR
jgi:hypothetical protein